MQARLEAGSDRAHAAVFGCSGAEKAGAPGSVMAYKTIAPVSNGNVVACRIDSIGHRRQATMGHRRKFAQANRLWMTIGRFLSLKPARAGRAGTAHRSGKLSVIHRICLFASNFAEPLA